MLINWWAMYACLAKFLNLDSVLNVNMVVAAFNQERALLEAFSAHWFRKSQFSMSLSVLPQQIRTAHARDFVTLSVRGSHFRSSEITTE